MPIRKVCSSRIILTLKINGARHLNRARKRQLSNYRFTVDLMHYAADVRLGKLNPAQVYGDVELPVRTFKFVAALNDALRTGTIKQFLADLPPQQPEYKGLIEALASYRLRKAMEVGRKLRGVLRSRWTEAINSQP